MDSFTYEISSADVYEELRPHARDYFDFSNYPESHMLKNSCNKKVPAKFKDEFASKCITKFVGLRSKMYSFMFDDKKDISKAEVRVAKVVQKSVIFNNLRFYTYLNCLWNDEVKEHNFKTIHSMKHSVATYTQSKITLCPFEDKKIFVEFVALLSTVDEINKQIKKMKEIARKERQHSDDESNNNFTQLPLPPMQKKSQTSCTQQ